jgi:hypothetical protein
MIRGNRCRLTLEPSARGRLGPGAVARQMPGPAPPIVADPAARLPIDMTTDARADVLDQADGPRPIHRGDALGRQA